MKKRILALVVCIMVVASFVACGGPKTLETYYGSEIAKKLLDAQLEQQLEDAGDVYSDITYEVSGNTLTYICYFAEEMESDAEVKAMFEEILIEGLDQSGPQIKADTKVTEEITIGYIIYNPDGSEYVNVSKSY